MIKSVMTKKPTAMKKTDLKSALAASIGAEQQSVEDRFKRAESLLGDRGAESDSQAALAPAPNSPRGLSLAPPKIERVIRDSFTMPEYDHNRIADLQGRCLKKGIAVTKSEIIRAGLIALQALSSEELCKYIDAVEKMKPGRPAT